MPRPRRQSERRPLFALVRTLGKSALLLFSFVPLALMIRYTWINGTLMADPAAPPPATLLFRDFIALAIALPAFGILCRSISQLLNRGSDPRPDPNPPPSDPTGVTAPLGPRRPAPLAAHARPA